MVTRLSAWGWRAPLPNLFPLFTCSSFTAVLDLLLLLPCTPNLSFPDAILLVTPDSVHRWGGKGVSKAVESINTIISPALKVIRAGSMYVQMDPFSTTTHVYLEWIKN